MPFLQNRDSAIAGNLSELIGGTPMVYLSPKINNTKAKIALKIEGDNPMASVKDRLGIAIIETAEKEGKITPGKSVLIEATSGNTGIALAQLAAARGYKIILTMPETMSIERRALLTILGAEVRLTPAAKGMSGAIALANQLARDIPDSFLTEQFKNPANAKIHRETTGPEIWKQTGGNIDYFLSGVGTGGTVSGVGQYLRSVNSTAKVIAIEPEESPVLSGGKPGPHKIAGIGAGFVPEVFDRSVIDEVVQVNSTDALEMTQKLPPVEGLFCGISGGAAIVAALRVAARPEAEGKTLVVIVPSFGERYLSTAAFATIREAVTKLPVEEAKA